MLHKSIAHPSHLIFLATAREIEILFSWSSLAYKKCQCAYRLFLAFFYVGAHGINYMFFCLDAKEPKNQGCDGFTKNELREAKMQKLASLKQFTFFNASLHPFS
ncbi:hypothetical protein HZP90_09375 [Elizabethkingia anophelis]|nr:hypothetical protein [Elizabethkingia anophelis]MCT4058828.1 hypothetical protein [Elizabethkingia anophelis]MCT4069437.1 hypothetical protein [Elizabethkingia anophelis]